MACVNQIVSNAEKLSLKIGRVICRCYSPSSFQLQPQHMCNKLISSSSRATKILSESTIIIQDGISIEELPILIRRATKDTYPFTSHSYSGESIRQESEFDSSFKEMLQNCNNVSDVFNLLEVPSDKVQGHSAVYALQRLHVLMCLNSDWLQIHSFIRKAVIGELYQIVERDIKLLSNFSLVSLLDCYFAAEGFSPTCFESMNQEISHRLIEGLFSAEELLSLIQSLKTGIHNSRNKPRGPEKHMFEKNDTSVSDVLSENASVFLSVENSRDLEQPAEYKFSKNDRHCKELLRNSWVHLASRCTDLDENTLPWTMQLLSVDNKMFVSLLDKQMTQIWPYLSAETAAMCLDNLVRLRSFNSSMMTKLGQWAFVNIHLMTPAVLLSFLNVFMHFSFLDKNLIGVMERCLAKTGSDTPTDLLALCMEYLRSCKYVSPIVMDTAADHFIHHWESYNPLEIFAVLRSYGQLGYLPAKPQEFLFKAETCLDKRFDVMDEAQLLEVLASFTFVNILPKNFFKRVTCEYFFNKIGALKNPSKTIALMWLKIMKHAVVLGSSQASTEKHLRWVMERRKKWSIFLFHDQEKVAIVNLKAGLSQLFGPDYFHVISFYSCCAVYVDEKGRPLKISYQDGYPKPVDVPSKRLVILLRCVNHFTSNTKQLMGAQQQRQAHLIKLGFLPLEIRAGEFHCQSGISVLKTHLSDHIDFKNPEVLTLKGKRIIQLEEKYLKDWMEDGTEEDDIKSDESDGEILAAVDFNENNKDFSFWGSTDKGQDVK